MLLKRNFKLYAFIPLILIGILLFTSRVWQPQSVICPLPLNSFSDYVENPMVLTMLVLVSFLLHDNFEIELALVCGVKTSKLTLLKVLPLLIYSLIPSSVIYLLHRYIPFENTNGQYQIRIPIHVPDNYKIYLIVSLAVTVLFFTSLFLFIRILTRNCYITVGIGLFISVIFDSMNRGIKGRSSHIGLSLIDPYISSYFIGDNVPKWLSESFSDLTYMSHAWTVNRLIFFAASVILFTASYFLLRREKLHEGFGE